MNELIGSWVQVKGDKEWIGTIQYVTQDGWVGVRQGKRVDEVPLSRITIGVVRDFRN